MENLNQRRSEILREAAEDIARRNARHKELLQRENLLETQVLRGHLLLEEVLRELIEASVPHPEFVTQARLRFPQMIAMAQSMYEDFQDHAVWDLLHLMNELRNDLAHRLEASKRTEKLAKLRRLLETKAPEVPKDDVQLVSAVVEYCLAFLAFGIQGALASRRWIGLLRRDP